MESAKQPDTFGYLLIISLLILITIAGIYSYKSIDFAVLDKLEKEPLIIPDPPSTNSANIKTSTEYSKIK